MNELRDIIGPVISFIIFFCPPLFVFFMPSRQWVLAFNGIFLISILCLYVRFSMITTGSQLGPNFDGVILFLYILLLVPIMALTSFIKYSRVKDGPSDFYGRTPAIILAVYCLCAVGIFLF